MSGDPARASAVRVLSTALALVVGAAFAVAAALHLTPWYPAKAAAAFALVAAAALRHLTGRHPFPRFGAANQITTGRAALMTLTASLVGEPRTAGAAGAAVALAVAATLLDGVDGWVARRTRTTSAFGMRFDLETDAALILVLAVLAWQHGKAGAWVLASGLLRYLFVAAGRAWPWMRRPLAGSRRGRAICVLQLGALILALVPAIARPASSAVAAVGLSALGYSFLIDTVWLWRMRAAPAAGGVPGTP